MIGNLIKSNGTNMGIERLQEALLKWEKIYDDQEKRQHEAELTKIFWENSGKLVELLRSPERRLIRESRTYPISVLNYSRFSSHWFILLTDIFIHVIGTSHTVHPLPTLWVDPLADSETVSNAFTITAPEENLVLYTATPAERNEWLHALQNAIKRSLQRVVGHAPPRDRTSTHVFLKHQLFKDAKYTGEYYHSTLFNLLSYLYFLYLFIVQDDGQMVNHMVLVKWNGQMVNYIQANLIKVLYTVLDEWKLLHRVFTKDNGKMDNKMVMDLSSLYFNIFINLSY